MVFPGIFQIKGTFMQHVLRDSDDISPTFSDKTSR